MIFGQNVVQIVIKARDEFSKTFNKANLSMQNFRKAALIGGVAGGVIAVGLVKATKAAVDAQEVFSKFNQVFDEVGQSAEQVAEDFAKNFGLAGSTARKLLGDTGDLLSGFGFTDRAALKMSKSVNELAADLASFTNIEGGTARASQALTRALLGERESIKSLGIAILETDIQARLAEKGMKNLTGAALKQAKAQVTLEIAMEQSKNAIGDFNRTQDQAANQIRIVQERFQELQEEIGFTFIPVLETLLPKLTELLQFFKNLPPEVKQATAIVGVFTVAVTGLTVAIALLTIAATPWLILIGLITLVISAAFIAGLGLGRMIDENLIPAFKRGNNILGSFLEILKEIAKMIGRVSNFFGGFFGGFGGSVSSGIIPSFQTGGVMPHDGLASLHKGETIIPANQSGGVTVNIGVVQGLDAEDISRALSNELNNKVSL